MLNAQVIFQWYVNQVIQKKIEHLEVAPGMLHMQY